MYYTSIPLVSDRPNNRRWDASKLRELRKRLDSGTLTVDEIDAVAADFVDGEIVDLASDWLGNTVSLARVVLTKSQPDQTSCRLSKNCLKNALLGQGWRCWKGFRHTWQ